MTMLSYSGDRDNRFSEDVPNCYWDSLGVAFRDYFYWSYGAVNGLRARMCRLATMQRH